MLVCSVGWADGSVCTDYSSCKKACKDGWTSGTAAECSMMLDYHLDDSLINRATMSSLFAALTVLREKLDSIEEKLDKPTGQVIGLPPNSSCRDCPEDNGCIVKNLVVYCDENGLVQTRNYGPDMRASKSAPSAPSTHQPRSPEERSKPTSP